MEVDLLRPQLAAARTRCDNPSVSFSLSFSLPLAFFPAVFFLLLGVQCVLRMRSKQKTQITNSQLPKREKGE